MDSIYNQIKNRVKTSVRGSIFYPDSFSDIGSSEAVRIALMRLVKAGILIRIAQGIYSYPKIDKWDGAYLYPSIEDIAMFVASRDKLRIIPTGEYVLNLLGLSTQVPANAVFITDGSQRRILIGKRQGILFKHTSQMRSFAYKSKMMQMIVFALRAIEEGNIANRHIEVIKKHLDTVSLEEFRSDLQLAPIWIRKILTSIKG